VLSVVWLAAISWALLLEVTTCGAAPPAFELRDGDRVAFLNHGKILREGTLNELLRETGVPELRFSPPDPDAIAALIELAKQRGLNVVSSKAPMRTLEAFYLSVLGKDKK
jgi:ABC-type multidrug transport system ATPase subunit